MLLFQLNPEVIQFHLGFLLPYLPEENQKSHRFLTSSVPFLPPNLPPASSVLHRSLTARENKLLDIMGLTCVCIVVVYIFWHQFRQCICPSNKNWQLYTYYALSTLDNSVSTVVVVLTKKCDNYCYNFQFSVHLQSFLQLLKTGQVSQIRNHGTIGAGFFTGQMPITKQPDEKYWSKENKNRAEC